MTDDRIPMPFHPGELRAQALAGVETFAAPIRNRMPDQHRTFFPLLPFLAVAVADAGGWPLATLVQGPPGFAASPDPARLDVAALPAADDPARPYFVAGTTVGMLGIDLGTRRRNRLNGVVAALGEDGLAVDVVQSFGNCPRYIHVRALVPVERTTGPVTAFGADLPQRARDMLAASTTLFVASSSGADAPGATRGLDISHRGGPAGFASSPDPARLDVAALPAADDPARPYLAAGTAVGMLGVDLGTRRRNRLNGVVAALGVGGFAVDVVQSFGNCPRYIHVRSLVPVDRTPGQVTAFGADLPQRARDMLAVSTTLFVASSSGADAHGAARGLDISHRGGPAGFARLDGNVLTVPDYAGNRYFNTLGNFVSEPRAAIVLADIASGDVLQLQGIVDVDWTAAEPERVPPVERVWRLRVVRGWLRPGAFGLAEQAGETG